MSCSQFDKYMSKAAIPRVESVSDPILDAARGEENDYMSRYKLLDKAATGLSNFDFDKDKFSLNGE